MAPRATYRLWEHNRFTRRLIIKKTFFKNQIKKEILKIFKNLKKI